ncbi:hypothetical protein ACFL3I_02180 [Pseudomonadota bacterium]
MDTTQIEADLSLRTEQSRTWLEEDPAPLTGLKFKRDTIWEALPIKFLDDKKRVERHGVRFKFYVLNYTKNIDVELDVRIHPLTEVREGGESLPYVVTYVVDQLTGADVEITHRDLIHPRLYKGLADLSIEDWYRYWIERTLRHKKSSKIFRPAMALPSPS